MDDHVPGADFAMTSIPAATGCQESLTKGNSFVSKLNACIVRVNRPRSEIVRKRVEIEMKGLNIPIFLVGDDFDGEMTMKKIPRCNLHR